MEMAPNPERLLDELFSWIHEIQSKALYKSKNLGKNSFIQLSYT